jgi:hypothetical protein
MKNGRIILPIAGAGRNHPSIKKKEGHPIVLLMLRSDARSIAQQDMI